MYFKVYQDKDCCGDGWTFHVVPYDEIIEKSLEIWMGNNLETSELMPVIEPVMMTEKEFNNIPEFEGF